MMNSRVSLKININERFSIRVDAEVLENRDNLWQLKTPQDSLSSMISSGGFCEIGVPGKKALQGRISNIRPLNGDWLSVNAQIH